MTRDEHLYTKLAEECSEVQHRLFKLLHFGPHEAEPGQSQTNIDRLRAEVDDLLAVVVILEIEGLLPEVTEKHAIAAGVAKRRKIDKYLAYSVDLGCTTVSETSKP